MKIGIVGTSQGWSSELLADTVEKKTGYRLLVDMDKVCLDLSSGRAFHNGVDLSELDALLIKKIGSRYSPHLLDRLELLRFLNGKGLAMFSRPEKILRVLDRLSCTITLRLKGIPMPPTTITEDVDQAVEAIKQYKRAVLKPLYTSKARGMVLFPNGESLMDAVTNYKKENPILYIQKAIDLGEKDLGIVFLGGNYLTTYARRKTDDSWNTTTASGGRYEPYHPDDAVIALAKKAQEPFGLDFTCVDVALSPDGPMVFEVSAFGGFRGILEASGLDVSSLIVDDCIKRINKSC